MAENRTKSEKRFLAAYNQSAAFARRYRGGPRPQWLTHEKWARLLRQNTRALVRPPASMTNEAEQLRQWNNQLKSLQPPPPEKVRPLDDNAALRRPSPPIRNEIAAVLTSVSTKHRDLGLAFRNAMPGEQDRLEHRRRELLRELATVRARYEGPMNDKEAAKLHRLTESTRELRTVKLRPARVQIVGGGLPAQGRRH